MAINLYSKASVDSLLSPKLSISSLTNAATTTLNATAPTTNQVLSFDGTQLKWATPAGGATWGSITGTLSSQSDLNTALNARVSTAGDTMDNNAILEFNDTYTNGSLGLTGNAVTLTSSIAPGESGVLNYNQLILTDSVGAMQVNPTGLVFPDSTVQSTAYTGGGTFVGDRLSIYAGYLYNEQTASNVTTLTLGGASTTMQAKNFTLQTGSGGVITFSDGTTQSTAANLTGYAPLASPTFTGTVTIPAGASISGFAPLASPSLTGTPLSITAAADTNTTQIATTAYVVGQASSTTPAATGTAAVGTSLKYARADHVHANPLPTGGTTGQVLSKVDGTSYNVQWSTASGGGGGVDVQTFGSSTTSGSFTWTKPSGAKWVEVYLVGGGGGGGSGARQATTSGRSGGGGGGGAPILYSRVGADSLGATETVVVGAGGIGNAGKTTDNTIGNGGANASSTTFAGFTSGRANSAGGGGTTSGGAGSGTSTSVLFFYSGVSSGSGGAGATTSGSTASGQSVYIMIPLGGGGGAGAAATSTINAAGGAGAGFTASTTTTGSTLNIAGGNGGTIAGVQANPGTDATTRLMQAGTGGGGGFYRTGQAGGTGGAGGWPGGGGGGGGASDNGFTSGAGGNGGNGLALIITYCG